MKTLLVAGVLALAVTGAGVARSGPKARFKATPKSPVVGQRVKLDASASKCKRCHYQWRMIRGGKPHKLGKKSRGKVLRYRFRSAGVKRIRLTVTDRKGKHYRRTHKIRVLKIAGAPTLRAPGGAPPGTPPGQSATAEWLLRRPVRLRLPGCRQHRARAAAAEGRHRVAPVRRRSGTRARRPCGSPATT